MIEDSPADPGSIQLRPLGPGDIPFAMKLTSLAGWNQLRGDWEFLIDSDAGGNYLATYNDKPAGTTTTLVYQKKFSWIGMVLVDPFYRGKGIGTALLKQAIEFAEDIGTAWLDATPQGKKLYDTMGFVAERELFRLELTEQSGTRPQPSRPCNPVTNNRLDEVIKMDAAVFGADRGNVLQFLYNGYPEYAYSVEKDGKITGYCFGRSGSHFEQIGPVIAEHPEDARNLLMTAMSGCSGKRVIVDAFTDAPWLQELYASGFKEQRPFFRMYWGKPEHEGNPALQYASSGPEFG